jgi:short-subunit dehydrogenase
MVISNAGGANRGRFTNKEPKELAMTLRLRAHMHAEPALHFGRRLMERGSNGMLFAGAMGADLRC